MSGPEIPDLGGGEPKDDNDKKKGAAPYLGNAAKGASSDLPFASGAARGLGSRVLSAGRGGAFSGFAAIIRSPLMMGLLLGATAVGGGYGIVTMLDDAGKGAKSSGVNIPKRGEDGGALAGGGGGQGADSLGLLSSANPGGPGGGADGSAGAAGGGNDAAAADAAGGGDAGAAGAEIGGTEGEGDGKSALMEKLAESMKKDQTDDAKGKMERMAGTGGAGGAGAGGGGTSASLSAGGWARSADGAGAGGAKAGKSRAMAGAGRTSKIGRPGGNAPSARSAAAQLRDAKHFSNTAAGQGETGKFTAGAPFDGNAPGSGSPIGGAGVRTDGSGLGPGGASTNPPSNPGGPTNPAGNIDDDLGECESKPWLDECGDNIPEPDGGNVTPYQQWMDLGQKMIKLASVLLLASFIVGFIAGKLTGPWSAYLYTLAKYLAMGAAACAAMATVCGAVSMAYGQTMQGGIMTVVGALLTAISYQAWTGNDKKAAAAEAAAKDAAAKRASGSAGELVSKGADVAAQPEVQAVAKDAGVNLGGAPPDPSEVINYPGEGLPPK